MFKLFQVDVRRIQCRSRIGSQAENSPAFALSSRHARHRDPWIAVVRPTLRSRAVRFRSPHEMGLVPLLELPCYRYHASDIFLDVFAGDGHRCQARTPRE